MRLHLHRPECPSASPRATVTKHRTDAAPGERCKCRLNVAVPADIENDELLPDRPRGPAVRPYSLLQSCVRLSVACQ